MKAIITLVRKDIQLLILDRTSLIVTFVLPIALLALIGSAFAKSFPPSAGITSYDYAFSKVVFWGLIGGAASSVASLAIEKHSGTLIRLKLAPVRRYQILAAKTFACMVMIVITSTLTWLVGTFVFDIKTNSYVGLVLVIFSNSLLFAGLMTFLSTFANTERAAGALSWTVLQILACFSGIMFPLAFMPTWMINISNINPVTWAVRGMEVTLWQEGSVDELWLPLLIPAASGLLFFGLSLAAFRRPTQRSKIFYGVDQKVS